MANPILRAAKAMQTSDVKRMIAAPPVPRYQDGKPQWSEWDTDNAIKEGFKRSTWVYACVWRIMRAAASVPWVVNRRVGGKWEPVPGHPLELLLETPNPFMSRQDLIERTASHLYLGGNALWQKVTARKIVAELWPMDVGGIKPVPSQTDFIARYEYRRGDVVRNYKPDEVIHFAFTDPANPYWGMSPLQAAARTVDTDVEAVRWNKVALQNRAITDGVFTFGAPLTKEQWEEARDMIRKQHQGADNARTPWVLGGDAKWQPMSLSPAEMDFIESRRMTREEICSVFGVPPVLVGIFDQATLANAETSVRLFWRETVIPFLTDVQGVLQRSLVPAFGNDLWLTFDTSGVTALQESTEGKVKTAVELWKAGMPWDRIVEMLDMEVQPWDGWDVSWVPTAMQPSDIARGIDAGAL